MFPPGRCLLASLFHANFPFFFCRFLLPLLCFVVRSFFRSPLRSLLRFPFRVSFRFFSLFLLRFLVSFSSVLRSLLTFLLRFLVFLCSLAYGLFVHFCFPLCLSFYFPYCFLITFPFPLVSAFSFTFPYCYPELFASEGRRPKLARMDSLRRPKRQRREDLGMTSFVRTCCTWRRSCRFWKNQLNFAFSKVLFFLNAFSSS